MKKLIIPVLLAIAVLGGSAYANPPGDYWADPDVDTPSECVEWANGYSSSDHFYIAPDGYISHQNGHEWRWNSYARCILRGAVRTPGTVDIFEDGSVFFLETSESMCLPLGACND